MTWLDKNRNADGLKPEERAELIATVLAEVAPFIERRKQTFADAELHPPTEREKLQSAWHFDKQAREDLSNAVDIALEQRGFDRDMPVGADWHAIVDSAGTASDVDALLELVQEITAANNALHSTIMHLAFEQIHPTSTVAPDQVQKHSTDIGQELV